MLRETGLPKDSMASNFYISDQLFQTKIEREEAEKNVLSVLGSESPRWPFRRHRQT